MLHYIIKEKSNYEIYFNFFKTIYLNNSQAFLAIQTDL